jgi:Cu-Zn family superoxide dismutase
MTRLAFVVPLALALAGCAAMTQPATTHNVASADLKNATGQSVGTATLTEVPGGVRILVEVKGLPAGAKGVHIHEVGKCEGPQFTTAGGHFNPDKKQHGTLNPQGAHAGDLPNIVVDNGGAGRLETTNNKITLGDGPTSLFDADGSAIVVHAAADDFRTDPTGNSGGRIVCGVIVKRAPRAEGGRQGY